MPVSPHQVFAHRSNLPVSRLVCIQPVSSFSILEAPMRRNEMTAFVFSGLLVLTAGLVKAEDVAAVSADQHITQVVKQKLAADEPGVAPRVLVSTRGGGVRLMGQEVHPAEN